MMRAAGVAAALVLAGCASGPQGIETTRFHLGQPIPRAAIAVAPADAGQAGSLEAATYTQSVAGALGRAGFSIAPAPGAAEYLATFSAGQQFVPAPRRGSGLTVGVGGGVGGGGYRSGGGIGGGVSFPVGERQGDLVTINSLALTIKRRSDGTQIWEGRASEPSRGPDVGLAAALPRLADALLQNFPGPTGQTVLVKPPRGV